MPKWHGTLTIRRMTTVTSAIALDAMRKARTSAKMGVPSVLRQLMTYKRLRMYHLAAALEVEPQSMSARLNGKTVIKQEELAALAVLFEVPVGVFYMSPDEALRWVLDHPPKAASLPNEDTVGWVNSAGQRPSLRPTRRSAASQPASQAA